MHFHVRHFQRPAADWRRWSSSLIVVVGSPPHAVQSAERDWSNDEQVIVDRPVGLCIQRAGAD